MSHLDRRRLPATAKFYLIVVSSFIALCLFIPWINPLDKMESGTYSAYTESLLLDGDFNIIDQLPKHIAWYASPTFNHPDTASTGIAILWAPFFAYGHFMSWLVGDTGFAGYSSVDISQMIASIFFGFALVLLVFKLLSRLHDRTIAARVAPLMFFGSGMFYFFLSIPTNNDVTAATLGALTLLYAIYLYRHERGVINWGPLGLLAGLLVAVKPTTGTYFILSVALAFMSGPATWSLRLRKVASVVTGFAILVLPLALNTRLQRGDVHDPRTLTFHPDFFTSILDSLLFGHTGYFWVTPIYLLALGFFAWQTYAISARGFKNDGEYESKIVFLLSCVCWLKVVLVSFRYFHNEYFGPRVLLTEFAIFAVIFAELFKAVAQKGKSASRVIFGMFAVFSGWTFLQGLHNLPTGLYLHETLLETNLYHLTVVRDRWLEIFHDLTDACLARDYWTISFFVPLILGLTWVLHGIYTTIDVFSARSVRVLRAFAIMAALGYLVATGLNLANNGKNVARLQASGFFVDVAIIRGPYGFLYENVLSEVKTEIDLAQHVGDAARVNQMVRLKERYLALIKTEIITDPLGKFGRAPELATSFWDDLFYLREDSFWFKQRLLRKQCQAR